MLVLLLLGLFLLLRNCCCSWLQLERCCGSDCDLNDEGKVCGNVSVNVFALWNYFPSPFDRENYLGFDGLRRGTVLYL